MTVDGSEASFDRVLYENGWEWMRMDESSTLIRLPLGGGPYFYGAKSFRAGCGPRKTGEGEQGQEQEVGQEASGVGAE